VHLVIDRDHLVEFKVHLVIDRVHPVADRDHLVEFRVHLVIDTDRLGPITANVDVVEPIGHEMIVHASSGLVAVFEPTVTARAGKTILDECRYRCDVSSMPAPRTQLLWR
jgi:hypothetical protein